MPKLIILRGPSAAGKSTIAKQLQGKYKNIAVFEQDHFNQHLFRAQDREETSAARHEIVKQSVIIALAHGHDVILEGFYAGSWKQTISEFLEIHPEDNYIFYFDISFEETVKRHSSRSKVDDFGPESMKKWYTRSEKLGHADEIMLSDNLSKDEIILIIENTCKLS
jgi:adenylate kinase family enzyme